MRIGKIDVDLDITTFFSSKANVVILGLNVASRCASRSTIPIERSNCICYASKILQASIRGPTEKNCIL